MSSASNTYRNLSSDKIVETLHLLGDRINQRFPRSGLYEVCRELEEMAKHTAARAEAIARPVLWLRLLIAAVAIGSGLVIYGLVSWALQLRASDDLAGVLQGLAASV